MLTTLFGGAGCSNATLELKNASQQSTARSAARATPAGQGDALIGVGASDQTSDVIIDSVLMNIYDVGLSANDQLYGSNESAYLYTCDGDCEIDLVGEQLANLLVKGDNTGSLDSGTTYSSVMIATCRGDNGAQFFSIKVKARAALGGTMYYTQAGSPYMTSDPASYGHVEISFQACRNYSVFSDPIVADGGDVTVSLFIDLRNFAQVVAPTSSLYGPIGSRSACSNANSSAAGSGPILCVSFPEVAGTLRSELPTIERYKLVDGDRPDQVPDEVAFYFDGTGQVLGGYLRPWIADATTETTVSRTIMGFKRAFQSSGALGWTDYSGGGDRTSTNGDFTVLDFPRPDVGAPAQPIVTIVDRNGAPVTGTNYLVTRID